MAENHRSGGVVGESNRDFSRFGFAERRMDDRGGGGDARWRTILRLQIDCLRCVPFSFRIILHASKTSIYDAGETMRPRNERGSTAIISTCNSLPFRARGASALGAFT